MPSPRCNRSWHSVRHHVFSVSKPMMNPGGARNMAGRRRSFCGNAGPGEAPARVCVSASSCSRSAVSVRAPRATKSPGNSRLASSVTGAACRSARCIDASFEKKTGIASSFAKPGDSGRKRFKRLLVAMRLSSDDRRWPPNSPSGERNRASGSNLLGGGLVFLARRHAGHVRAR